MRKIVFHIGDKKTGSTSIQQALVRGAWRCGAVSLDYAVGEGEPYHHELAFQLYLGNEAEADRLFRNLAARILASRADVVVVSSELFRDVPPQTLKDAIARHLPRHGGLVEVLAYMRPHAAQFLSNYAQVVKLGHFLGDPAAYFDHSLRNRRYFKADLFRQWRDAFGDRFHLRPMVRQQLVTGDVVGDFFHRVLDGAEFALDTLPPLNASPSLPDLVLLRSVQVEMKKHHASCETPELRTARLRVGERLSDILCDHPRRKAPRLHLHRALVERIADAYGEDAARADAEFFDGTPMQEAMRHALETAPDEIQSIWARDHYPPEVLRLIRLWARMTAEMLLHAPEGWNGHFVGILNRHLRGLDTPVSPRA